MNGMTVSPGALSPTCLSRYEMITLRCYGTLLTLLIPLTPSSDQRRGCRRWATVQRPSVTVTAPGTRGTLLFWAWPQFGGNPLFIIMLHEPLPH